MHKSCTKNHCRRRNGVEDNKDTTSLPCALVPNEIFNLYLYKNPAMTRASCKQRTILRTTDKQRKRTTGLTCTYICQKPKFVSVPLAVYLFRSNLYAYIFSETSPCLLFIGGFVYSASPLSYFVPIELNRGMKINAPSLSADISPFQCIYM
jgi:hypothetical protein